MDDGPGQWKPGEERRVQRSDETKREHGGGSRSLELVRISLSKLTRSTWPPKSNLPLGKIPNSRSNRSVDRPDNHAVSPIRRTNKNPAQKSKRNFVTVNYF